MTPTLRDFRLGLGYMRMSDVYGPAAVPPGSAAGARYNEQQTALLDSERG